MSSRFKEEEGSSLNTAYSETEQFKGSSNSVSRSSQKSQPSGLRLNQEVFSPREQDQATKDDYGELRTLKKLKSPRNSKGFDKCLDGSSGDMSPEPDILSDD